MTNMAMSSVTVLTILFISCINYGLTLCPLGYYEQGVSEEDRQTIVDKHNELRDLLSQGKVEGQPRAKNMKQVKYSQILEEKAQEIANLCEFEHVFVEGTEWSFVGQNIHLFASEGFGKGPNWSSAIQSWFNENKKYKFGSDISPNTGHYTQLVWANTDNVGCGYAYYAKDGQYKYNKLYVCNYGPGGNIEDEDPYQIADDAQKEDVL